MIQTLDPTVPAVQGIVAGFSGLILEAARYKAWFCGCSLAEIADSSTAWGGVVCVL